MYTIDVIALKWGIGIFIFFFVVWIIIAKKLLKSEPKVKKVNMADRYDEISDDVLKNHGIDSNEFKKMTFEKFGEIHNALTNYNYEILKKHLTNDLFQYYVEQLENLRKVKHKNIMKDFELLNVRIYKVSDEHGLLRIDVYMNVRMFDYVIDVDTGECIKGNNVEKIDFEFELCFEKRYKGSISSQFVMSKKSCINDMLVKENNN